MSIWLAFIFLCNACAGYVAMDDLRWQLNHGAQISEREAWSLLAACGVEVVALIAIAAMWFWRKAGFYTYLILLVMALIGGVATGNSIAIVFVLLNFFVMVLLVGSRLHQFD